MFTDEYLHAVIAIRVSYRLKVCSSLNGADFTPAWNGFFPVTALAFTYENFLGGSSPLVLARSLTRNPPLIAALTFTRDSFFQGSQVEILNQSAYPSAGDHIYPKLVDSSIFSI